MNEQFEYVDMIFRENVAVLTLSREEKLNAMSLAMVKELTWILEQLSVNENARCVVITGKGRAFSAGGDIAEQIHYNPVSAYDNLSNIGQRFTNAVEQFPTPVIAAVNGYALGGGAELALACDIRLFGEKAIFALPEVTLGLLPGWGGTQRLLRLVGQSTALELICTGKKINAQEAVRIGLASRVAPGERLMEEALELATQIALNPPTAVRSIKRVLREGRNMPLAEALDLECAKSALLFGTKEAKERMTSFLNKN